MQREAEQLPPPVKLAIGMVEDRLEHASVISMPVALLPAPFRDSRLEDDDAEGAMVPSRNPDDLLTDALALAVVPSWNPDDLLTDALALAVAAPADGYPVRIGAAHAEHAFLQVVRTDLQRRAVQLHSDRRAVRVAVVRLRLNDRVGDAGVLDMRPSSSAVELLDLLSLLDGLGFQETMRQMVVWKPNDDAILDVACPGNASLQPGGALLPVGRAQLDRQLVVARIGDGSQWPLVH